MKNFSTQCTDKVTDSGKSREGGKAGPCKQTLDFLKQFARVYHAEPALTPKSLCGFILN
ncbi:MAG: hypothetical protein MdMp024_0649 [Bacteroidales bacterium]